jgi:hypothetical protein
MTTNLILTIAGTLVVGLVLGAIIWQVFICAPEVSMADADRLAAIEDRDNALDRLKNYAAVCQDLERERSVNRYMQRELHERSLTPHPLGQRQADRVRAHPRRAAPVPRGRGAGAARRRHDVRVRPRRGRGDRVVTANLDQAGRIAAAVREAGCNWPDAPCPCTPGACPVDLTGAVVFDHGATDESHVREWDACGGAW